MLAKILIPVISMAALGLLFGGGLAYTLKIFGIKVDPVTFKIISLLPGINCGACGKAGCAAFAEALKKGEVIPSGCVVSNDKARRSIAELLGIDYNPAVKNIATLLCNGGNRAKNKYAYHGIKSCKAASLVFGGHKACAYGCLGLGDCVEACPFDAIAMGSDNLPVVDEKKCTACGKCVRACPKNLFVLLPASAAYYVKCSSRDPGGATMKKCSSGCITCLKCQKACPAGAIEVKDNLSRIDPSKCRNIGKCIEVCPTKVIVKRKE